MEWTVGNQLFVFGGSIVCGAALGLVFDLFRIHRKFFNVKTAMLAAIDVIFWIVAALIFARFITVANNGMVRFFELGGIFIGSLLYMKFASRLATNLCVFLLRLLNKTAVFIIKIVAFPCVLAYKILKKPCILVVSKFSEHRKKLVRFAKRV